MDPFTLGVAALLAGTAATVALVRHFFREGDQPTGGSGQSSSDSASGGLDGELGEWASVPAPSPFWQDGLGFEPGLSQREKAEKVRKVLGGDDSDLADLLLQQAGRMAGNPRQLAEDDDAVADVARRVDDHLLEVLSSAAQVVDQVENIELKASDTLVEVPFPADEFDVEPLRSDAEIGDVLPEELALPSDVFDPLLSEGGLHVTRHYERSRSVRRLYILLDVSGSMGASMSGGGTRTQWAAGLALSLMLRAQADEAQYLLRFFDGVVHELRQALDSVQAERVAQELLRLRDYGGGTDIQTALRAAVQDIQSADGDVETSDILLISDGESFLDEDWLRQTFGKDIRLHVAMIGLDNPTLADPEISSSYKVYY